MPTGKDNLQIAIEEAERFLAKAKALQAGIEQSQRPYPYREPEIQRLNAAMKRSSLDLYHALPPLRK